MSLRTLKLIPFASIGRYVVISREPDRDVYIPEGVYQVIGWQGEYLQLRTGFGDFWVHEDDLEDVWEDEVYTYA